MIVGFSVCITSGIVGRIRVLSMRVIPATIVRRRTASPQRRVGDLRPAPDELDDSRVLSSEAEARLERVDVAAHLLPVDADADVDVLAARPP